MTRIAAIGERAQVQAYALAGVLVAAADDAAAARAAWRALPPDVGLVILTPAVHTVLAADGLDEPAERLFVVLPT